MKEKMIMEWRSFLKPAYYEVAQFLRGATNTFEIAVQKAHELDGITRKARGVVSLMNELQQPRRELEKIIDTYEHILGDEARAEKNETSDGRLGTIPSTATDHFSS